MEVIDLWPFTQGELAGRRETVAFVADLLAATAARPARLNCFGLHEWAMVYRAPSSESAGARTA